MTSSRRRLYASLIALAGSCLLVVFLTFGGSLSGGISGYKTVASHLNIEVRRTLPPLSAFGAMSARPLFNPERRPNTPAVKRAAVLKVTPPPPPPPLPLPDSVLVAVAIGPFRKVVILRSTNGKEQIFQEGQTIEGWKIAHITPDQVTLRQSQQRAVLGFVKHQSGAASNSFWSVTAPRRSVVQQ